MRLIDADKLMWRMGIDSNDRQIFFVTGKDIDKQPTVDAVPVVRCKDCVSCYQSESSSTGYRCKCWGVYDTDCECDPNGFCHKGERRDRK